MPRLELLCYPKMHGENVRLGKRYLAFLIGSNFSLPKKSRCPSLRCTLRDLKTLVDSEAHQVEMGDENTIG
jgi:hypothetical protein